MTTRSRSLREKQPQASTTHDRWLVSYADFVTLLFALFVVLFASARHNTSAVRNLSKSVHAGFDQLGMPRPDPPAQIEQRDPIETESASGSSSSFADVNNQLHSALSDSIAKHQVIVEQNRDGLVISLRELGFFNSGNAELLATAREPLVRAAKILSEHHLEMRVEGHSDDQPIHNSYFQSNWQLSTARAMTVLLLLVNECNFDPQKISLAGYGPYRPIASNDTAEGRRMNRRVDLVILEDDHKDKAAH